MTARQLSGGCLCGTVAYQVADEFIWAAYCHCGDCRRTTGSAFQPIARIERSKFAVTQGMKRLLIYGDAVTHDAHCGVCGSLVYSQVSEAAFAHVPMGTLIDAPSIRPSKHIFVGSKAPWFEITDDLPQHEGFPP